MASFFEKLKKGMGIEEGELSSPTRTSVEGEEESQAVKKVPKRKRISVSQKEPMKKPRKLEIKKPLMEEEPEEEEEPMITESPVENEEEAKREEILMEKVGEKTKEVWEKEKEEGGAMRTKSSSSPSSSIKEEWPSFSGGVKEDKSSFPPFADAQAAEGQLAIDVYQTEGDLVVQSAIAGVRPENLDIVLEKDILSIKGLREKPFNEEGDYFSQECYWGPFSREIILPAEVDPNQAKAQMKEGVLTIRIPKILREKKRKVVVTS